MEKYFEINAFISIAYFSRISLKLIKNINNEDEYKSSVFIGFYLKLLILLLV